MKITISSTLDQKQPVLVLGLFEENKSVNLVNSLLDKELDDELSDAQKNKEFSSKFGELYSTKISKLPYRRIVVLGLGKKKELDAEKVRKLWGKTINAVKALKQVGFTTNLALLFSSVIKEELLGKATAEGLLLANYSFNKYLSKERQDKKKPIAEVSIQWKNSVNDFEKGINTGKIIAEATNFSRDLVNEPASVVNSLYLEKAARDIAKSSSKLKMHVLDEPEMKKLGMGALLGVNAGSKNPPKLIFLEYSGGGKEKPSAFIGKGITFDSGGYNLKPTKYIEDMHTDMGGAAAVLGTIKAAAELGVKNNLVGVMAVCENMVSDTAQHPGTIVKAFNGKSIVVGNTDAEGRLVLADALAYTQKKYNPSVMIDLATLTGACVVALGYYATAAVGKDDSLLAELKDSGLVSGDKVWPMPFFDEYQDWMDGSYTDLNNIAAKGKGYEAGSITAGVFLSKFVDTEKTKWVHLDIAGTAYWSITGDYFEKGATGAGVRVLSYWLLG